MTDRLLPGSAVDPEHGDSMTNDDDAHQGVYQGAVGERRSLEDLDLFPQGLADAPASETDPDSLVYAGNS
jgi:hypothetical protein